MKLAIELQLLDGSVISILKSEEFLSTVPHVLINDKVLDESINLIFEVIPDYKHLLSPTTLTYNQRIVILYFLIDHRIYSSDIINRWLLDAGLDVSDSNKLSLSIFNAHLDNIECINEAAMRLLRTHNFDEKPIIHQKQKLSDILDLLIESDSTSTIYWCHDGIINNQSIDYCIINISHLPETHFEVEDEDCIVVGLSVSFTEFIICVANGNTFLQQSLCDIVSIELRDQYSVSTALHGFPEIKQVLLESGYHSIDYYGVNKKGILTTINSFTDDSNSYYQSNLVVPLYIKLIK